MSPSKSQTSEGTPTSTLRERGPRPGFPATVKILMSQMLCGRRGGWTCALMTYRLPHLGHRASRMADVKFPPGSVKQGLRVKLGKSEIIKVRIVHSEFMDKIHYQF